MDIASIILIAGAIVFVLATWKLFRMPDGTPSLTLEEEIGLIIKEEREAAIVKKEAKQEAKSLKAEVASTRARKKGKFVADDPATPEVNEAFLEGQAPPKKRRKPAMKIVE